MNRYGTRVYQLNISNSRLVPRTHSHSKFHFFPIPLKWFQFRCGFSYGIYHGNCHKRILWLQIKLVLCPRNFVVRCLFLHCGFLVSFTNVYWIFFSTYLIHDTVWEMSKLASHYQRTCFLPTMFPISLSGAWKRSISLAAIVWVTILYCLRSHWEWWPLFNFTHAFRYAE